MRDSFDVSKSRLLRDHLGKRILAMLRDPDLREIACRLEEENPYKNLDALSRALALAGAASTNVCSVLEHHLWCAWREARWATLHLKSSDLDRALDIEGIEWLEETRGNPTILIAPMTLCTSDTINCITLLAERVFGSRPLIFYGENMSDSSVQMASVEGLGVLRQIMRVLSSGGVFCTYADFVYQGHSSVPVTMFGCERPMSSGFIYLATRPLVHVLPCLLRRRGERIIATFAQSFLLEGPTNSDAEQSYFVRVAGQVLAATLEGLIRRVPEQWLLLSTLTFDSPEMAEL